MLKEEIKIEINKVLDELPDSTLQDLLGYLKSLRAPQSFIDEQHLMEILTSDRQLLQKLAQ